MATDSDGRATCSTPVVAGAGGCCSRAATKTGFGTVSCGAVGNSAGGCCKGDVAAGETAFNRQCVSCHIVQTPDGTTLAGRNARTGPNLWGIAGEAPGAVEGFNFSDGIKALAAAGVVWDEDSFVGYVMNPTGYVRERTGDNRARVMMAFQVRDEQAAHDIWAYLSSLD